MRAAIKSKKKDIRVYYKENRFWDLLKRSQKYKDLYNSKEALVSLLLSIITLSFFMHVLLEKRTIDLLIWMNFSIENGLNVIETVRLIQSLLPTIIGGYFSLLGFSIGALAILTGTLGNKIISNVNDDGKIKHLMNVIFTFYFSGSLMGFSLVLLIFSYLATFTEILINVGVFVSWVLIVSYIVYFSIIYAIMLFGTCIRLFLLGYKYYDEQTRFKRYKISSIKRRL